MGAKQTHHTCAEAKIAKTNHYTSNANSATKATKHSLTSVLNATTTVTTSSATTLVKATSHQLTAATTTKTTISAFNDHLLLTNEKGIGSITTATTDTA
jgi:hypothetical protein